MTFKRRGEREEVSQAYLSSSAHDEMDAVCPGFTWVAVYIGDGGTNLLMIRPTAPDIEGVGGTPDTNSRMAAVGALRYNRRHRVVSTLDLAPKLGIVPNAKISLARTKIRLPGEESDTILWAGNLALEGVGRPA